MKRALALLLLSSFLGACTRSGPGELLETAKFEELQTNIPHARKLYAEIVERYPDSPEARTARERLDALDTSSGSSE